jgi:cysteinyl-tRNA synthetase
MKLYNTLTKKNDDIKPLKKGLVTIYNCGPTVYDNPTIGNLRTYINVDLLRRSLKYAGLKVKEVMNITDIEDKIIRDSLKLNVPYTEITEKYEKVFLDAIERLNIEKPEYMPRATEEIPEMIKIIEALLKSGYAYKSDDGSIYFSINKFKPYGTLSDLNARTVKAGARVSQDEYDKDNAQDFALWKAKKAGEPSWKAPFGEGRPGWHIECSAMSTKYLGPTIDIHCGGVDLIFPHHENEIAQSEAYTKKPFVRHWFHTEHLLINGGRMGKSLRNAYTLDDLKNKYDVDPLAFRLLCLSAHYKYRLNFTDKSIIDAQTSLNAIRAFVIRLLVINSGGTKYRVAGIIKKTKTIFEKSLQNDLAMPKAISSVYILINEVNKIGDLSAKEAMAVYAALIDFDKVLGLGLEHIKVKHIPDDIHKLAVSREDARKAGDFKRADKLRADIDKAGYSIEDTQDGPVLREK